MVKKGETQRRIEERFWQKKKEEIHKFILHFLKVIAIVIGIILAIILLFKVGQFIAVPIGKYAVNIICEFSPKPNCTDRPESVDFMLGYGIMALFTISIIYVKMWLDDNWSEATKEIKLEIKQEKK